MRDNNEVIFEAITNIEKHNKEIDSALHKILEHLLRLETLKAERNKIVTILEMLLPDEYFDSEGDESGGEAGAAAQTSPEPAVPEPEIEVVEPAPPAPKGLEKNRTSHSWSEVLAAVRDILSQETIPMQSADIVAILESKGYRIGGDNQVHVLRVQMGKSSGGFTAVRGKGWLLTSRGKM